MAQMIDAILADLKAKSKFGLITRNDYTSVVSAEELMGEMEAVGKFRSPRFVIDKDNFFAYENIAKWLVGDPTMECLNPETKVIEGGSLTKGLYLAGKTGTGKTWAMDIAICLASAHGFKFKVFGRDEALRIVKRESSEIVESYVKAEGAEMSRVLLINDLGTESREAVYMGNRKDVLRDLLVERGESESRLTLITSNYPMAHPLMAERYGERVMSRLRSMCNYLEMRGEDRRV